MPPDNLLPIHCLHKHLHGIYEAETFHNPPIHRKKKSSLGQYLSMLCFYKYMKTRKFLWTQYFDRKCACNPTV
jgi:hypothetical protein